jgi:ParB family transcriptional regulator, chromosome partitioning protein
MKREMNRKKKPARAASEARKKKSKQRLIKQSGVTELAALPAMKVRRIKIPDVVVKNPRELNPTDVAAKAESMATIGLKTPPTVRKVHGQIELVAGEERLEAARLLGWEEIDAAFFKGGKIPARMWHHLENLDHSDKFTPLEKAEKLAEVVELKGELISRQNVEKKRGRPIGTLARVQATLPIKGKTAKARIKRMQRALKINELPSEVKAKLKGHGLDKKQSVLLDIIKEKASQSQLQKIDEIVKRNVRKQAAKRNRVKKSKAKAEKLGEKASAKKHPDNVIFAELRSQCPADLRRTWAAASTKVKRRFLRAILKWEGGKPLAEAD